MQRIGAAIVGFLCLAAAAGQAADGDRDLILEPFKAPIAAAKEVAAKEKKHVSAGLVVDSDPQAGKPVEFVLIDGGGASKAFEISRTLVTVEQYRECVIKGKCKGPGTGGYCNWGKKDRGRHPINCVNWKEVNDFAAFKEARLPSEAEYEHAATSRGKHRPYPWGRDEPTCTKAAMYGNGGFGCGSGGTMPVCANPEGNTEQGLCDMVGNVWQWVGDARHDASAGSGRVGRGGSFNSEGAGDLRVDARRVIGPETRGAAIGFRLARSSR